MPQVEIGYTVFIPIVIKSAPLPSPTPTPTATESVVVPIPTGTPVPTQEGPGTTGDVSITTIFYDGVKGSQEPDEYVEIKNLDSKPIQLSGWTLRDNANHIFTFPDFVMQPECPSTFFCLVSKGLLLNPRNVILKHSITQCAGLIDDWFSKVELASSLQITKSPLG